MTFKRLLEMANAAGAEMAEFHDEMANVAWAEKPEGEKAIHFLKSLVKTFAPQKATELLKYLDRIRKSQKWYGS